MLLSLGKLVGSTDLCSDLALLGKPDDRSCRNAVSFAEDLRVVPAKTQAVHTVVYQLAEDLQALVRLFLLNDIGVPVLERSRMDSDQSYSLDPSQMQPGRTWDRTS